jgi:alanine dehydrogenase
MKFGVPKERRRNEHRVGLSIFGVSQLTQLGHEVYIEADAGSDCLWTDQDYRDVDAEVVFSKDEVYQRSDLVCRFSTLGDEDVESLRPEGTICGFLHLAVASRKRVEKLIEKSATLIGYEIIEHEGRRPLLLAISEIAGQQAVQTAAYLLKQDSGGRGLLLGAVPGIPAPTVVVLGAGTAGQAAARLSLACGVHVIILDVDVEPLRKAQLHMGPQLTTAVASVRNLERFTEIADVLIGAVLTPGAKSPFIVTEEMVKNMRPGSVIIDLSIDQGGCIETSRPTKLENPTFKAHDVIHYCVPNMTAAVPRTASRALTISVLPYLQKMAHEGAEAVLAADPGLARGLYVYKGKLVNEHVARLMGQEPVPIAEILSSGVDGAST